MPEGSTDSARTVPTPPAAADIEPVQAVVPAAGEGTRMRPLTADRPKALVEVGDRPLLAHVLDALRPVASECVVVVGYRGDRIRDQFGPTYRGLELTYARQHERRGLADALLQAEPHVEGSFVSLNGDNVLRADLPGLVARHREAGADVTAFVDHVSPDRARRGAVFELGGDSTPHIDSDSDGAVPALDDTEIVGLVEKPDDPPSTLVPRGCYALSERIFAACRAVERGPTGELELTAAIDRLLGQGGRLATVPLTGWCLNVNTPADCERAARRLAGSDPTG